MAGDRPKRIEIEGALDQMVVPMSAMPRWVEEKQVGVGNGTGSHQARTSVAEKTGMVAKENTEKGVAGDEKRQKIGKVTGYLGPPLAPGNYATRNRAA